MRLDARLSRGTLIVLAVAVAAASLASPAAADHGRRYKGSRGQGGQGPSRHVTYVSRGSSAGPAIAGFIGGFVLANVLAHAAPPPPAICAPAPDYTYYDPYCQESFESLEAYGAHLDCVRHPAIVRVIEVDNGRCVGERAWRDGGWRDRYDARDRGDFRNRDGGGRDGDWNR